MRGLLIHDGNQSPTRLPRACRYRKSALRWHPDRHSSAEDADKRKAEAMFKDVSEAYTILSDPAKRRQFDAGATFDGSGDVEMDTGDSPFGE